MCIVCGTDNDASAKAEFFECVRSDGEKVILTIAHPNEKLQSYPNRMHGGMIAALIDESMGRTSQIAHPDIWAFTADMNIRYKESVPLDQTLYIESRLIKMGTRLYECEGRLFLADGTICATATARFFIVPFEKAFPEGGVSRKQFKSVKVKKPTAFEFCLPT